MPPTIDKVLLIQAGTGMANNKNTKATKKPINGAGNNFRQLNGSLWLLSLVGSSFEIKKTPTAQVETVLLTPHYTSLKRLIFVQSFFTDHCY